MTYRQFEKFCGDFDLCPDILSKPKAFRFFNTLATLNSASKPGQLFIDENLFVEALALTAYEVVYKEPQPDSFDRLILLLEKMSQSKGPAKVQMAYGVPLIGRQREVSSDLTLLVRQQYPERYGMVLVDRNTSQNDKRQNQYFVSQTGPGFYDCLTK